MESPLENRTSLVNEAIVSLYLYMLIPLTDYNLLYTNLDLLAWLVIANILLSIPLNISKTVYYMVKVLTNKLYARKTPVLMQINKSSVSKKYDVAMISNEEEI